jgi:S1-C subfamily serine protease
VSARIALIVAGIAILSSLYAIHRADRREARTSAQLEQVQSDLAAVELRLAPLQRELARTRRQVGARSERVTALARAVLKSVFTIETTDGRLGSGFFAWGQNGDSFFVTADHVVAGADMQVRVMHKGGSWGGQVERMDPANDLALIRVDGSPKGLGQPLWPDPGARQPPAVGDPVILIGSPYGLEGTVTTGVVSRVTQKAIQTDAAANPGNSGGPVIDTTGRVLGVLVRGGGENINFAIPIALACVSIRDCGTG